MKKIVFCIYIFFFLGGCNDPYSSDGAYREQHIQEIRNNNQLIREQNIQLKKIADKLEEIKNKMK